MKIAYITEPNVNIDKILELHNKFLGNQEQCAFISIPKHISKPSDIKHLWLTNVERLLNAGIQFVICMHPEAFRAITSQSRVEVHIGCLITINNLKVTYAPSINNMFHNPDRYLLKFKCVMDCIKSALHGDYSPLGSNIIHSSEYICTYFQAQKALQNLYKYKTLTCDIETHSLKHYEAKTKSIAFAWDEHNGMAMLFYPELLKDFFSNYQGKLIFHNITYDVYVLVYELFMSSPNDYEGMEKGLDILLRDFEDTKLIAYLATNNAWQNELGLKALAHPFAGNYAQENIDDIEKIPVNELLEYNLKDCLCTWYVYKNYGLDGQEDLYNNLFKPAVRELIAMQLNGMSVDIEEIAKSREYLETIYRTKTEELFAHPLVQAFDSKLRQEHVDKYNRTHKTKQITIDDVPRKFNPNSNLQLSKFLYEELGIEQIDGNSTSKLTLDKIKVHRDILDCLSEMSQANKILNTFIPALEANFNSKIYGKQNLGKVVSGRLSSDNPNLANLPSGSTYGKLIKSCFKAPKGKLMIGIDFSSLEDRISALLTRDPNKLKVYTDGYDSHSLRAYSYFKDNMPDITEQLNAIEHCDYVEKITHPDGTIEYKPCKKP